jgi:hypothetical protein
VLYETTEWKKSFFRESTSEIWIKITKELKECFNEIEFNVDVVKSRWGSLRLNFKRTYEKVLSNVSDARQNGMYYEMMDFLEPVYDRINMQKKQVVLKKATSSNVDHSWSDNDRIKFLKILQRFPEIYNPFDPDFRNANKKRQAITVIINIMKIPQFDTKDKISSRFKTIRDYLIKTMENGGAEVVNGNGLLAAGMYLIEFSRQKKMIEEFEVITFSECLLSIFST